MTGSKVTKTAITIAGVSRGQFIVKYLFYLFYLFIFSLLRLDKTFPGHKHHPLPFTATLHQNRTSATSGYVIFTHPTGGTQTQLCAGHTAHTNTSCVRKWGHTSLAMADQAVVEKMSELQVGATKKVK